ncbi:MAG TPA: MerR family transcriptional regulator [Mesorhizobium sp.]|jgi:DNA-binding transcriptional MerR regulator|uniref:MerR family transcriptional regulator n=1 Tax=Mesorhizobium sp. TaxID=1871066 RepID=UPI002DDCBD44|nr:MerR family transcriptional regulator [Mesorhizobium sp.]HEV2502566.1 MerR family transcriptional regulator [Mesorhizobium sp.]
MDKLARDIAETEWLTAAECAGRIGLTVRALRLYERYGLIAPRRTDKDWRLYGAADVARLTEVLALKRLGLSLSAIASLLAGKATNLERLFVMQQAVLRETRERAEQGLVIVEALRTKLARGDRVSIDDLVRLAKETQMTDISADAIAWRSYEQARPRTAVEIDADLYTDYAGHYQLRDGPGLAIIHRDGHLFIQVTGQPEVEAFPESDHAFFLKVVPAQITFTRSVAGVVDQLVLHQGGLDIPAQRIDETVSREIQAALDKRIRDRTPAPDSEALLRATINDHMRGEPDFERMSPALAAAARTQKDVIAKDLARLGALVAVTFRGVSQEGWDVYDVRFERGEVEWSFSLTPDGKFSGMLLRPRP